MRIGVDIDGVLYPFNECANAALVAKFGIPDPGPWRYWNFVKDTVTAEQWRWLWSSEGQDAAFSLVECEYPDAVDAVNRILHAGHEVHFVTHRDPRRTALHTVNFLTYRFGGHPWAGVHVMQAGTKKHKLARWDAFVDDKAETVFDFLYRTGSEHIGPRVFSPVRPWNEELFEHRFHPRLVHYTDAAAIADWVLAQ